MNNLLRDFLLSYCPAWIRQAYRPESTLRTLRAATWGGLVQLLLAGFILLLGLKNYFVMRAHELAPHSAGVNSTGEAVALWIVAFEYLLHPFSLFLIYLAIEGSIRFAGGLITGEVVPSMAVSLFFKASQSFTRSRIRRQSSPAMADLIEHLPDGRIQIASATAKIGWNASITIGISGQWFEVEREEDGKPPRPFVYILRPAPLGKILRRYEEFDLASALGKSVQKNEASKNIS
jgi:hypothetical protein